VLLLSASAAQLELEGDACVGEAGHEAVMHLLLKDQKRNGRDGGKKE